MRDFLEDHPALLITGFIGVIILIFCLIFSHTASWKRGIIDIKSDWNNGIEREINVYTADGELLAHYEGKIDIDMNEGGYIKFDFEGKRYIYYNCFVETIAEIE